VKKNKEREKEEKEDEDENGDKYIKQRMDEH
jgi:hypothetical protein